MRLIGLSLLIGLAHSAFGTFEDGAKRPNFVFILTDDQDVHMNSLEHMPRLKEHLSQKGTVYEKHYCTVAICCPSRVNLWTGQMAHNTNVTDVNPPHGGYPKFVENGFNEKHLALWMQESGYNTYYSGKLFNAHSIHNYNDPLVKGYTGSEFLLDPFTYQYWNSTTTRNGQAPVNHAGEYSPDVVAESAYNFLEEAVADEENPFFLTIAPIAPHADMTLYPEFIAGPPKVAPRHEHLFKDYQIPRTPNFNPDVPSGVSWVSTLEKLNDTVLEYNDEYQRCRLRSLQAVDEMVEEVVHRLEKADILDNTYIIYTSDNGYHISQHRMHPGKECGFETDINVPLIMRGPGIEAGAVQQLPTSHTDLAPTIMHLAGNSIESHQFDGAPVPSIPGENSDRQEHVGIEFWGLGLPEGKYGSSSKYHSTDFTANAYVNNTYKGLRVDGPEYSFYYSVWCTNERELYDLKRDPDQIRNLFEEDKNSDRVTACMHDKSFDAFVKRLDALMMVTKSCKESSCVHPWRTLHTTGDVNTLGEALHEKFDEFYDKQPTVSFSSCELGYMIAAEGPQWVFPYPGFFEQDGPQDQKPLFSPDWSLWV